MGGRCQQDDQQPAAASAQSTPAAPSSLPLLLQVVTTKLNEDAVYAAQSAKWSREKLNVTAHMGCPKTSVGSIIGKGGEMKRSIAQVSGAAMDIDQKSMGPLQPRKLTLSGSEWAVNTAMHLIRGVIQTGVPECPAAEAIAMATAGGAAAFSRTVPCPSKLLSTVIGRKGTTIRYILPFFS